MLVNCYRSRAPSRRRWSTGILGELEGSPNAPNCRWGASGLPAEVAPIALLLASDPGGNLFLGQTLGPNSGDVMP